ncbi:MAG: D-amino acid aminotransferase [Burkholderiales bacterium]|nr:D-amino acid aminotransferase [Burkholderiales bacterium]
MGRPPALFQVNPALDDAVYLNGEFMPLVDARIPVLDRGFIFGDGIYEVVPVYSRQPFRLDEHLRRLDNSLAAIRLRNPHSHAEWRSLLEQLIARQNCEDQYIYLHITRGVAKRDHAFPVGVAPTIFMMSSPLMPAPHSLLESGIAAITAQDNRWLRCDIKATSLLPNVLLRQLAVDAGTAETLLLRDGNLIEGSASSVFAVHDDTVLAPPKNHLMLPGITYDVVLELAAANGIRHEIREIPEREMRGAQELWLLSSTREVLAITALDGKPVGNGKPGALFKRMYKLYQDYKMTVMRHSHAATKA